MTEDRVAVSRDGLSLLQSAAEAFARTEFTRIVDVVIEDLRSQSANGNFGDVAARHLWDEYCWSLQEGSLSDLHDDIVSAFIQTEVEKLSKHALILLSAQAFEEDDEIDEVEFLGNIWIDGIVSLALDQVRTCASDQYLDLIGPHRGDVICYEVEGSGMVWSILSDRGEAMDLISSHCDALLDPEGDLSELADEMIEAFMAAAAEDDEGEVFTVLLDRFEDDVRALVRDKDVLPCLENMRAGLLDRLDR